MIPLPGAPQYSDDLTQALERAIQAKGPGYQPRTKHRTAAGGPKYTNRLIQETSPYLLQHAHNPVNWYPWGDEAFATAANLGRPVLLSIGYATCHWCHVMEEESFEDEEIAAYLNAHFVAIKVDREERPDVDGIYMAAVQLTTGSGGWPMTVALTPSRHPFFAATYLPPRDGQRGAGIGLLTVLQKLSAMYQGERERIAEDSRQLTRAIQQATQPDPGTGVPGVEALTQAASQLAARFDLVHGGFGYAPKFPRPSVYDFLLRYWRRTNDPTALEMVTHSLEQMARGGLYDQLGGGFHRYSVDAKWSVPHFEKMLYDNAQLAVTLLHAHQASGRVELLKVAEETLEYVEREMTSPDGAFYSATDADSAGHEGLFFVWTQEEFQQVLGPERAKLMTEYFGVTERGNFEGRSVLYRPITSDAFAAEVGLEIEEVESAVAEARLVLYAAREKREHPLLDDKIIVEWNAQMISAFLAGAIVTGKQRYRDTAVRAAKFTLERMLSGEKLLRTYRGGEAKHRAVLEDYAYFIGALLDLFEATGQTQWLDAARNLQRVQDSDFIDRVGGGYFTAPSGATDLLAREKPAYDGAQPSGNSVAVLNLLRLAELTDEQTYWQSAESVLRALSSSLDHGAVGAPMLACALDEYLSRPRQLVIVWPRGGNPEPLMEPLRRTFLPSCVRVMMEEGSPEAELIGQRVPWAKLKSTIDGQPTAYVCRRGVCEQPTTKPEELLEQLTRAETDGAQYPTLRFKRWSRSWP